MPTKELTQALEQAMTIHSRRWCAGAGSSCGTPTRAVANPPVVVIHGNQTQHVPDAYRRFLENHFRATFRLMGTPMRVEFRSDENPFAGRRNPLTPRQVRSKQRLMRHTKGGKR
jgi:GTP-binding protein